MKKLKTNKAIAKRFKITKNGKVLCRPLNQNHYGSRDTGEERRKRRKIRNLSGALKTGIITKSRF